MAQPVIFESRQFLRPGGYSKFKLRPQGNFPVDTSTMVLIGKSDGGIPYNASAVAEQDRPMLFTNINDARDILRKGPLLDACEIAFAPSSDPNLSGASRVVCVRVQPATQAQLVLQSNSINTTTLKSSDYGSHTNNIAIQAVSKTHPQFASVTGVVITIFKDSQTEESEPLYAPQMELLYPNAGPAASMSVSYVSATDVFRINDGVTDIVDVKLSDFQTIDELAEHIRSKNALIEITVIDGGSAPNLMDDIASTNFKNAAFITTATYMKQLDWLNRISPLTDATQIAATLRVKMDAIAKTYLSGGSTSTPTNNNYIGAITLAEKVQAFYQIELSGDADLAQINKRSVFASCDVKNRRERIGGSGALATDVYKDRQQNAKNLNSMFYIYGASPVKFTNSQGQTVTLDPIYLPVFAAAINAGNGPTTPATFKALNCLGNPEKYTSDEIDEFIKAGCLIVDTNELTGAPQITRSVTTYQGGNLIASEMSMVTTALALVKDFRIQMENLFISATGTSGIDAIMRASALKLLESYVTKGWLTDVAGEAYGNLELIIEGDRVFIKKDATLTAPINFIFDLFNLGSPGLS
jgi:hypothetical protein